jgi:hypothetical protein
MSPSSEVSTTVHVVNVDGPQINLVLNDQVISSIACRGGVTLVAGQGSLSKLPWDLTIKSSDGAVLGVAHLADPEPNAVLIRGTSVLTGPWPMSYGPAPAATCAAAPAT